MRFFVNSTVGIGGLLDPAKHMGLKVHFNDLGLTFAKWSGGKQTPYIVLPILGSSTLGDASGYFFNYYLFTVYPYLPEAWEYGLVGVNYTQLRASVFESERVAKRAALDPYTFQRNAYLQYRKMRLHQEMGKHDNNLKDDDELNRLLDAETGS